MKKKSMGNYHSILTDKKINNRYKFEIYWKNTCTFRYIPTDFNYCYQHKLEVFNSMIFKLVNILMSKYDFDQKLNLIVEVTKFNGLAET